MVVVGVAHGPQTSKASSRHKDPFTDGTNVFLPGTNALDWGVGWGGNGGNERH